MSTISAAVVDGQVSANTTSTNTSKDTTGTGALGKDSFLQLLVTQMQYQDPLNPSSDKEFIGQLAQFSALEEMQNLNQSFSNTTAYGLAGKNVIMAVGSSEGETSSYVAGYVQYVEMIEGKAFLSINNDLYSIDDLDTVVSDEYIDSLYPDTSTT